MTDATTDPVREVRVGDFSSSGSGTEVVEVQVLRVQVKFLGQGAPVASASSRSAA